MIPPPFFFNTTADVDFKPDIPAGITWNQEGLIFLRSEMLFHGDTLLIILSYDNSSVRWNSFKDSESYSSTKGRTEATR